MVLMSALDRHRSVGRLCRHGRWLTLRRLWTRPIMSIASVRPLAAVGRFCSDEWSRESGRWISVPCRGQRNALGPFPRLPARQLWTADPFVLATMSWANAIIRWRASSNRSATPCSCWPSFVPGGQVTFKILGSPLMNVTGSSPVFPPDFGLRQLLLMLVFVTRYASALGHPARNHVHSHQVGSGGFTASGFAHGARNGSGAGPHHQDPSSHKVSEASYVSSWQSRPSSWHT